MSSHDSRRSTKAAAKSGRRRERTIKRRALRIEQNAEHPLFLLSLTGEEILSIADVSRVSRDDAGKLIGYQRPEVKRHVKDIVTYLDGDSVVFPNSIILALDPNLRFTKSRGPTPADQSSVAGWLEIPVPTNGNPKPAWIVDGQQRVLALSKSKNKDLQVPVNAFVAGSVSLQRDQFLRINNTKPLPRGLITELLPDVTTPLPARLAMRKTPAALCDQLAINPTSPFVGLIRRVSTAKANRSKAVITDTSIVKMLQESITSPSGCLFPYRNVATGETDFTGIWQLLTTYWSAVQRVFPEAWGKSPKQSRLMHGAGIRAMGRLMDRVMGTFNPSEPKAAKRVERELRLVAPACRWTSGAWEELGGIRWNEIQNVPRHIRTLSNYLVRCYLHSRRNR